MPEEQKREYVRQLSKGCYPGVVRCVAFFLVSLPLSHARTHTHTHTHTNARTEHTLTKSTYIHNASLSPSLSLSLSQTHSHTHKSRLFLALHVSAPYKTSVNTLYISKVLECVCLCMSVQPFLLPLPCCGVMYTYTPSQKQNQAPLTHCLSQ